MKAKVMVFAVMTVLGVAAAPAVADHESRGGRGVRPEFRVQQGPPGQFKGEREREFRRERQPDNDGRGRDRLTEEERRDLRRDIDKANRELYRRRSERR